MTEIPHFEECPECDGKITQKIVEEWHGNKIRPIVGDACEACHAMFFAVDDAMEIQKIIMRKP